MAAAPAASSAVGGATGASAKKKVFRMRGYLKKLGQKGLGKWRKRYFKRDGDKLYYFIDQDDLKHHGLIDLLQMTSADLIADDVADATTAPVLRVDDEHATSTRFRITTMERTYELEAETPHLAKLWVKALQEWKLRATTISRGVDGSGAGEDGAASQLASSLASEYELYERTLLQSHTDAQNKDLSSELEQRRLEKLRREEQRKRERQQREEERKAREAKPVVTAEVPAPVAPVERDPITEEEDASAGKLSVTPDGVSDARARTRTMSNRLVASQSAGTAGDASASEGASAEESGSKREKEALKEEHLKANLAALAEKHLRLSSQLASLVEERQRVMKASETLFEDDANLQRLTIELQDLTQEEAYLSAACEWGYRRARVQEQEQCTSLAVLERRLVTKVGTSTQHRYQNVLKEETLRHQVNAQSIRVQALKESWEQMFELSARKSSDELLKEWQARLRKELAAFDAHKVQNELLRFEKQRLERRNEEVIQKSSATTEKLVAALTSSRLRLHQLRAYALAAPTDAPQTALMAQPLTKQIAQLLRAYFQALALSVKLSLSQSNDGVVPSLTLDGLWDEAMSEGIDWHDWPRWLTTRISAMMVPAPATRARSSSAASATPATAVPAERLVPPVPTALATLVQLSSSPPTVALADKATPRSPALEATAASVSAGEGEHGTGEAGQDVASTGVTGAGVSAAAASHAHEHRRGKPRKPRIVAIE